MKKIVILLVVSTLVASCGDMSKYTQTDANSSNQAKATACVLSEANARFEAGTLFVGELKETAKSIANTCLTRLALQKAGITEETQQQAEDIISNLKAMTSSK